MGPLRKPYYPAYVDPQECIIRRLESILNKTPDEYTSWHGLYTVKVAALLPRVHDQALLIGYRPQHEDSIPPLSRSAQHRPVYCARPVISRTIDLVAIQCGIFKFSRNPATTGSEEHTVSLLNWTYPVIISTF